LFKNHPDKWEQWLAKQEKLKDAGQPYAVATLDEAYRNEEKRLVSVNEKLSEKTLRRLNDRNVMTSGVANFLLDYVEDGTLTLNQLNFIVGVDEWFDPITAFVEVPHNFKDIAEALRNGEKAEAAKHSGIMTLNLIASMPGGKLLVKGVNKTWDAMSGGKGAYKEIQTAINNETAVAKALKNKANTIANNNKELKTELIKSIELRLSPKDSAGNVIKGKEVKISKKLKVPITYFFEYDIESM